MSSRRKLSRSAHPGLAFPIVLLIGCLGGEMDAPPDRSGPQDTTVVRPDSGGPVKYLYPRLLAGETWVFDQYSGTDTGTTATLEVVGDSVYGSDSVYIERLSLQVPAYVSTQGYLIENYTQTGRLYLRKSDQETVHDTMTTRFSFRDPGDTVAYAYREEEWSATALSGTLPDSIAKGAAWKMGYAQHVKVNAYIEEQIYKTVDTTYTRSRSYSVKGSDSLTVKAGTFAAFEIEWADAGSASASSGWFAPEAKTMIRQIDGDTSYADTTELSSYLVK